MKLRHIILGQLRIEFKIICTLKYIIAIPARWDIRVTKARD